MEMVGASMNFSRGVILSHRCVVSFSSFSPVTILLVSRASTRIASHVLSNRLRVSDRLGVLNVHVLCGSDIFLCIF